MIEESEISTYYAHKKILITGGTGFMGKVLVWKLLRSCPKLNTVYVLIRSKHGKNLVSRRIEIFNSPIFDDLKRNDPEVLDKVVLVAGDVAQEGIGLSDEDLKMLIDEVSIVFHGAAILKMDATLSSAVNVNTIGTKRMLDMAQKMKKLEAFVYNSTAYCCCDNDLVEEKIYPFKHNPLDVINLIRWMDPKVLEIITPRLIYPLPNTYIYSKRLTEYLLLDYVSKIPLFVVRPSIVTPAFKEPLPGWTDTFNGPVGLFLAGGLGIMRTCMINLKSKINIIPVDIAINSMIALPWANSGKQLSKEIYVYNISQTALENNTWKDVVTLFQKSIEKYPLGRMLWYPNAQASTNSVIVYTIKCSLFHYLPAFIIDSILVLVGQKPFLVRVHNKLRRGDQVLRYFTEQQWTFIHDNVLRVEKLLNDADKLIFPVSMNGLMDIQNYIDDVTLAAKIYILKDDMNALDRAKRTLKILYVVDKIVLVFRYYILWRIISFIFYSFSSIYY